ncbi:dTDP-4-dehydrorhamnose 3,5-epimerase [Providencia burhodogranariea]|uniref:dTDP-4-dehydrorhamnose 3,5-epimerase n=1 Tax=Providencia burhodogranariea DSM 19968 TaxID=1141662 RepID=K8WIL4_9GAMM|nr:dTDP-4-dehydrorhamnose 3,5-epimerase [Providencia burhodogranariea]EKT56070.1 dTDP-4-dehydrorhamnose 3,5-epimerase [Providencia burhodogranariea DSM 19968]
MNVIDTEIAGVKIIEPKIFGDGRGFFFETFQMQRYKEFLDIENNFVQDNYSHSVRGVLRGLHFQSVRPQGKLVYALRGEVYDVVVDIRPNSPSFKKWLGVHLSEDNKKQLWIPPGLAHGFLVLSDEVDFAYKCTDYYDPNNEHCLRWDDPELAIEWPIKHPLLSEKDLNGKLFSELF